VTSERSPATGSASTSLLALDERRERGLVALVIFHRLLVDLASCGSVCPIWRIATGGVCPSAYSSEQNMRRSECGVSRSGRGGSPSAFEPLGVEGVALVYAVARLQLVVEPNVLLDLGLADGMVSDLIMTSYVNQMPVRDFSDEDWD
jgi:hypothetical protein